MTLDLLEGPSIGSGYVAWRQEALARFTEETGTRVRLLPVPESANLNLVEIRRFVESQAPRPDVFSVDVIWPGMLAPHLVDLRPSLAAEAAADLPWMVANYTVEGRLLAMPYLANIGVLYYRTDLLSEYGFAGPPGTWDELEEMARAIQAGERSRARADFWGYVWEGALDEALTCNALEWQASEGGGAIVDDGRITVNNPQAVRAWRRASRWVGSISPPQVVAMIENDALRVWTSGRAAFLRCWSADYQAGQLDDSMIKGRFDVAPLPQGAAGRRSTLGGYGLAVSRYSRHPEEAIALVRYLCRPETLRWRSRRTSLLPALPSLYDDPEAIRANPVLPHVKETLLAGGLVRPSAILGARYQEVSEAYCRAVHAVLTDRKEASVAAAELERQLMKMTGLPAGRRGPGH